MATVQHANFIEYGRKGPARKSADEYEPALSSSGKIVTGRNTKVINSTEYERIKAQLNAKETAERVRTQKEQEKERLRALSREQVNSWNNTLSGCERKRSRKRSDCAHLAE